MMCLKTARELWFYFSDFRKKSMSVLVCVYTVHAGGEVSSLFPQIQVHHLNVIIRRVPPWRVKRKLEMWDVRNVWLLAQRKLGAKGQGWCNGPMLRSRFRRSSFGTPLAAIAAPGGTMKGSEVGHSSETVDLSVTLCWPDCVQLCSVLGFLIAPFIDLWEEKEVGGGGVAKKWKDAWEELLNLRK